MIGWSVAAVLLIILIILAFTYRRLKNQLRQEQSEVARLVGELASVEQELAEVKARRKKSFAAVTQALITVEKDYTISSTNKLARRWFGKPDKETTLMRWTRQHRLQELVDQTLLGKKMPPLSFNFEGRILEARARSVKQDKQVVAVALAIHDVTELHRLSRARHDLVANISHELRTPLASLQLLIETLLNGALDDKEMAPKLIKKMATQTDTLSQLAQEVLDLSLIESGQMPLKMTPCSLQAIVRAQIERMLPQAERRNLLLNLDIAEDVQVLVDETMVGRVITNLLHNAIKFTDTGSVTVSAQRSNGSNGSNATPDEGDWVTVSVSDTGIGIPPGEIDRIFERFYKVDRSRSRKGSGTGLGLAIAKHIIEAHGGHIWAKSDGSSGTSFYFTLPVEEDRLPVEETLQPA